jgi:hypothetical protein
MNNEKEIIEQAKKVFKNRQLSLACLYIGLIVLCFGAINIIPLIIGITLIVAFFVLSLIFWKCPCCGEHFEVRHGRMDRITHCPFCGVRLRYSDYGSDDYDRYLK